MLVRLQNGVFGPPERFFKSVEATYSSCVSHACDFRELVPEFYALQPDFLLNTENMDLGPDEIVSDTELPLWARDATHFCELMRSALESDAVSESLHRWIDLIFGYQRSGPGAEEADNVFSQTSYEVPQISSGLEREAYEVLAREFGQCAAQLFTAPHPQRRFRFLPEPGQTVQIVQDETEQLQERIAQLQAQLVEMTARHEGTLKAREQSHRQECEALRKANELEIKTYKETLLAYESVVNSEAYAPKRKLNKFGATNVVFGLTRTSTMETLLKPKALSKHPTQLLKPAHTESSVRVTQTPLSTSRKGSRRTKSITPPKPRPTSTLTLYKR